MNKDIQLFYIDQIDNRKIKEIFKPVKQIEKIEEEVDEVVEALINNDTSNLVEECWDVIQATLGLIKIKGLEKEFREGFEKHREKMLSRGYKLEEI